LVLTLAVVKIKIVVNPGTRPCLVGRRRLGEIRDMAIPRRKVA
jgi:hypothetical protein